MYSQEGPAQVDSSAAPVHGIIQHVEGEAGHFCLHQDAKVITCKANQKSFWLGSMKLGVVRGFGRLMFSPCHIPARDEQ